MDAMIIGVMPSTRPIPWEETERRLLADPGVREAHNRLLLAGTLSTALVRYRGEHGLSQTALGRRLGMTQPQVSRLEAGDHTPDYRTLLRICDALGLAVTIEIGPEAPAGRPRPRPRHGETVEASTQAVISIRPA